MNKMDWIFKKTSYSALSTSEKEALADLCRDEASFARLKGLLELSEQSLPEPPPAYIRTNLDALFDATYSKSAPQKQVKRFRLTYIILAAAAVIGVIFLLFPWTTNRGNGDNSPKVAKGPQTPKNEPTEITPTTPSSLQKRSQQQKTSPLVATIGKPTLDNSSDQASVDEVVYQNSEADALRPSLLTEGATEDFARRDVAQEETKPQAISFKGNAQNSEAISAGVYELKSDKNVKVSKTKKIDTGSMLKHIKPVF